MAYIKYNYTASATLANVLNDIKAVLTGTTDKTTLSAGCDQPNTSIETSIAVAGWTSHDDQISGSSYFVVKAPVVDDGAFYKYVVIDGASAGYIKIRLLETWNATSHTGTNEANAFATTLQQRVSIGTAGSLNIACSARFIAMQSITTAGTGASTNNDWTGAFERSRLSPWDTVANAYPPTILTTGVNTGSSSANGWACRYKNPAGGDYTTTNAQAVATSIGFGGSQNAYSSSTLMTTKVPDGLGGYYTPFNDLHFRNFSSSKAFMGGSVSTICDVWLGVAYPQNLDTVVANGKTYIFWQNSGTPSATGYTAFPKG